MRTEAVALAAVAALLVPLSAGAAEVEGRGVAHVGALIDSNPHRVSSGPEATGGVATGGRLALTLRDPFLEIEFDGGVDGVIFPALAGANPVRSEWHGRARIALGTGSRLIFAIAPAVGGRRSPTSVHDDPEGGPLDLVPLPRRKDTRPIGSWWGTYELRGILPVRFAIEAMPGLHLEGFGAARFRAGYGRFVDPGGVRGFTPAETETSRLQTHAHYEGGGGAQIRYEIADGIRLGLRTLAARAFVASLGSTAATGLPPLSATAPSHTRIGATALGRLRIDETFTLEFDFGWYAVHDDRDPRWLLGADGIVGRVEVTLAPAPGLDLTFGAGRDLTSPIASDLPGTEFTGYFLFDLRHDRVEPFADFRASHRALALESEVREWAWTGGGGLRIRLVGGLYATAGARISALNPSSVNDREFVAQEVTVGVELRDPSRERFPDRW